MAAINPSIKLAQIRSKIDAQQQIISLLEIELQAAILGGNQAQSTEGVIGEVQDIYQGITVTNGVALGDVFEEGIVSEFSDQIIEGDIPDQSVLRHMLYLARALLGELRIEEQQWLEEYNQEKTARKNLLELAKS